MKNLALSALIIGAISNSAFANGKTEEPKPKFEFSGAIEVGYAENDLNDNKKTLSVDEIELSITANINQDFNANVVILSEPKEGNVDLDLGNPVIDEATLNGKIGVVDFTVGKFTAPFGVYETALISAPAGEDIGETSDIKALLVSSEVGAFSLSAWAANSSNSGLSVNYAGDGFGIGVDAIRDALGNETADKINNKGLAIYAQAELGDFTFIAEQIQVDGNNAIPAATVDGKLTQLEVNYAVTDGFVLALSSSRGTTTNGKKNDTKTITYGASYEITSGVTFALESSKAKDESSKIAAQLVYEF
ncbi:MAG: porin [Candidatus Thioglobus sp.]|nr:MAG: porin [Candidatus Thioglobus sp.]